MSIHSLFKISEFFLKEARRSDDIEILRQNIGNYIHFTDSERFGINFKKKILGFGANPKGIYGYPLTESKFNKFIFGQKIREWSSWINAKYIYFFGARRKNSKFR